MNLLSNPTVQILKDNHVVYHSDCYKTTTNKTFIKRLKAKFVKNTPSVEDQSTSTEQPATRSREMRSKSIAYDKSLCIICQEQGGTLRKVMLKETGRKMLSASKLNTIPNADDAVANDVLYHLTCWVLAQRKSSEKSEEVDCSDTERILADIEIINCVTNIFEEDHETVLTINEVNITYNGYLNNIDCIMNFKSYLKKLLQENVADIAFQRPKAKICLKEFIQRKQ